MRKIVDIPEDVFVILTNKAKTNGKNLKRYIENLLCDDAGICEQRTNYNLSLLKDPSDNELKIIMKEASETAVAKALSAENAYFNEITKQFNNALKNQ